MSVRRVISKMKFRNHRKRPDEGSQNRRKAVQLGRRFPEDAAPRMESVIDSTENPGPRRSQAV